jgi:hypothetical protein
MLASKDDLLILDRCVELCENCASRITSLGTERKAAIYCRDLEMKCSDLREALLADSASAKELALQCLHSAERCAERCDLQYYDFCREAAQVCRQVADLSRTLAA